MKRVLLFSLGILLCAGVAFGQAGYIGLFTDPGYTDCYLYDDVIGIKSIYAVHKAASSVTASQFQVAIGPGMGCVETGVMNNFPTVIGSPSTGISIAYGACLVSDILLFTWNFFCQGTSGTCAKLEVVPDPAAISGAIEIVTCNSYKLPGNGSALYVNPNGFCDCGEVVPTRESSWGQIKALYQ
jgi:hypothetical protein